MAARVGTFMPTCADYSAPSGGAGRPAGRTRVARGRVGAAIGRTPASRVELLRGCAKTLWSGSARRRGTARVRPRSGGCPVASGRVARRTRGGRCASRNPTGSLIADSDRCLLQSSLADSRWTDRAIWHLAAGDTTVRSRHRVASRAQTRSACSARRLSLSDDPRFGGGRPTVVRRSKQRRSCRVREPKAGWRSPPRRRPCRRSSGASDAETVGCVLRSSLLEQRPRVGGAGQP